MTRGELPELPRPVTLAALQRYVRRMVSAREFTTDRDRVFILLVEEIGELARELSDRRRDPGRAVRQNLAHEIADVLLYLIDVANGFGIELAGLWDERRPEPPAPAPPSPGAPSQPISSSRPPAQAAGHTAALNQLVRGAHREGAQSGLAAERAVEQQALGLVEQVGEIATELRKSWQGLAEPRTAGRPIVAALNHLLRLAALLGVEPERAVRDKERQNADRSWDY
ncbi:MAG: hypothetical protein V3S29_04570 [bacterium]